jgi:hypothetical protein
MDARMSSEVLDANGLPVWDFFVDTDTMEVPIITDVDEANQQSALATYIVKGSIPQLDESTGVDWLGFIGGTLVFGDLDAQIREALRKAGHSDYFPEYDIVNSLLTARATKGG